MEKITDKIAALPEDGTYFSLEFFPPKTQMGSANLQARLERMSRALRPLFVTVTWGAGGSTATKSLELAEICQRQLGLTTCLHLTCTNSSKAVVDDALEQAKALGVRNILALRGDPPRSEEYNEDGLPTGGDKGEEEFVWAVDLVKYIRKTYGDYFCVGVAAYPEGHSDQSHPDDQNVEVDLPYLVEKTKAGADFIMTQLFFDVEAYTRFEKRLREHESGVFKSIPIIPGLMPIQGYQTLRRTTKLSHAKLPQQVLERLDPIKGDDEAVKNVGVDILSEIVEIIRDTASPVARRGFHFYTLNLEKAVAQIIERTDLIPPADTPSSESDEAIEVVDMAATLKPGGRDRRRLSSVNSAPHNRIVVDRSRDPSSSAVSRNANYEAPSDSAGIPGDRPTTRANTLAISEGEGSLGREATWDDFPNGRWGDARSPAFGEIDGYGVSLHVSIPQALKLWGYPTTAADINDIFLRHVRGELDAIPWSEEGLRPETNVIKDQLSKLIDKGWWTVASQPAVNGLPSSDPIVGWGPKNGFVFQKPFVELFLPSSAWKKLKPRLETPENKNWITYFAGDARGAFEASDEESVNPVTWGCFQGKEIVTPTIIEGVSFRAWIEEAFGIWGEWERVYPARSPTAKLLRGLREDVWLVNIIHHGYVEGDALWDVLLEE
ncbi:methylenetetrahydrofolate reduct [Aulographum hederae CBS 113979]|uniref:Methylenetetrahydrofolate reduct n=1 Tax=Aulographum hederae CBS 113979 TaxID=1176131 RepID=A0A6G1H0F5_9PEZI|nr:methylenetetrahydrofolate reduct [Aulographum hederae CBS 113979]